MSTTQAGRAFDFTNLLELEDLARDRVDKLAFDYIAGGAEDEAALRANRDDYARYRFVPRVMRDVAEADLATTLLGTATPAPVAVAPTGFHQLVHPEGETATVQGAHDAGLLFTASTMSNRTLEEIARVSPGPKWLQVYVFRDRGLTEAMVARAKKAGYEALVLTVDVPVAGRRERDHRNRFALPKGVKVGNFEHLRMDEMPAAAGHSSLVSFIASQFDASLTWKDVGWLKDASGLPVVVKGVLHPADARDALNAGADAVFVSNHGGRQLDHAVSALEALPAIVDAVDGRAEVYMDGGARRGTDVVKALCLGARAVFLGRPVLWGLALGGREGVARVLRHMLLETQVAMQLLGVRRVGELGPEFLAQG